MRACAPKRRAEFLAGRYCAKRVLEQISIVDHIVDSDNNRCPLWPEQVKGSISHNDHTAMAAITVSPDVLGIGIDIETIVSEQIAQDLRKQIVNGDEDEIFTLSSTPFPTLFTLIFSIKESFFKAAYPSTGHYFGFEVVRITSVDFLEHQFRLELTQDLNQHFKKGSQHVGRFSFMDNSVISLLVAAKPYAHANACF